MTSYVSADLRRSVELRANHLCEYCLIHEDWVPLTSRFATFKVLVLEATPVE